MMLSGCSLSPAKIRLLIWPSTSSSICKFLNWFFACSSLIWVDLWSAALIFPKSTVSTWYFSRSDLKRLAYLKISGVVSTPWMSWPYQIAPPRKSNFFATVTLTFSEPIMRESILYYTSNNPYEVILLSTRSKTYSPKYNTVFGALPECGHLAHIRYKSSIVILFIKVEMSDLVKVKGLKGKQNKKKWAKNIDVSGLL